MDDHPYYLHQRPNTFPVVPVSTLSAPIASSNIVRSRLPTVADLAGEPRIQFPTNEIGKIVKLTDTSDSLRNIPNVLCLKFPC